jgi:ProP effector
MGFEQLAALRDQLAKKAATESRAGAKPEPRAGAKPEPRAGAKPEPRSGAKPEPRSGAKPESRAGAKRRRPAPAETPAKPIDPVVHSIARLQKHFPKAFPKNPAPKVPLKVGTFEDLIQHATKLALTEAELREAIRTWCSGARYWSCMVEGAKRLDLEGQEAGVVSLADAKRAQQLKARRNASARSGKAKPSAVPANAPAGADAPAPAPAAAPADAPAGADAQ